MPKQPRPEDGDAFYYSIRKQPNGKFRVECRVMTSHGTSIEHLETECDTRKDARDWADLQAGARAFAQKVFAEPDGARSGVELN
jgi:hypothetical protein